MPNIYQYIDYVRFLSDFYEEQKKESNYFSYENLARKIGLKSKGALHNIIQGKRGISNSLIFRLCEVLGLNTDEKHYLQLLVSFKQANNVNDKNKIYEEIISIQKRKTKNWQPQLVGQDQFEFYSKYYHSVIRSLIGMYGFKDDYGWLAKNVHPRITPKQAKKSVELLCKLGMIKKQKGGGFQIANESLSTEKEVQSLAVHNFHLEMGRRALDAISDLPNHQRNVQGATLGISQKTYQAMCEEMTQFRLKLQKMAEEDKEANGVYRINFQLFPVSEMKIKGA